LVLPVRDHLSRPGADNGRARRLRGQLHDLQLGPEVCAGNREATALTVARPAVDKHGTTIDFSFADPEHHSGKALPGQGAERPEGLGETDGNQH